MGRTALKAIQAAAGSAGGADFYPYTIDNSARFAGSETLYRAQSTPTNNKKWTFSCWYKYTGPTSSWLGILGAGSSGSDYTNFYLNSNHFLLNHVSYGQMDNTAYYRDSSAWYHVVVAFDSTQASASNRQKIYVNGVLEAQTYSYGAWPLNFNTDINQSGYTLYIGRSGETASYSKQYLAECVFIDGQQLPPSDFAETKNGVWIPKEITGLTFGNNGFYLKFDNSGALGTDSSGNGNNFTVSGLTASDQMLDTPTLNYPTLQFNFSTSATTYSEGNLVAQQDSAAGKHTRASFALPTTGKWYWEVQFIDARSFDPPTTAFGIGVSDDDGIGDYGYTKGAIFGSVPASTTLYAYQDGAYTSGNNITLSNAVVDGDWFGIAYDADTRKVWLWSQRDNAWLASGNPSAGTNPWKTLTALSAGQDYFPILMTQTNDSGRWSKFGVNFGQQSFVGTAPTDFLQLNATNLPEPAIGPNSTTKTSEVFDVVLYTGNGTAIGSGGKTVSDYNFQPDMVWIKDRNSSSQGPIFTVTRGPTNYVYVDGGEPETTDTESLTSFTSTGFTLGSNSKVNASGNNFFSCAWKGGTESSNTDGSITSNVSVNTDTGISIMEWTGTGVAGTIGHGLGVVPDFVDYKRIPSAASGHLTWLSSDPTSMLYLSYTDATASGRYTQYMNAQPTTSTIPVTTNYSVNDSGVLFQAMCFAEKENFSKITKYTSNASTDGPFIYCGFLPKWVLIKSRDLNSTNWLLLDVERDTYNVADHTWLISQVGQAESTANDFIDILSNGVKVRSTNSQINSSGSYYLIAFAENPFKYSNAR